MTEVKLIRSFLVLAEELHFGRAATRLQIVQPALTQQIHRLEKTLGVGLLDRSSRRVALTSAGEVFVAQARKAMIQAEFAAQSARETAQGLAGALSIGFVDNAVWSIFPNLIREFRAQVPRVELQLKQLSRAPLLNALLNNEIDVAVMPGPVDRPDLVIQLLARTDCDVALASGHALCALEAVPVSMLENESFVAFPSAGQLGMICERMAVMCASAGFTPKLGQAVQQMHTGLALVSTGAGIAVVPRWMRRAWAENIEYRPLSPPQVYELLIAFVKGRERRVIERFAQIARGFESHPDDVRLDS